ncbi:MAG: hypothetical protein QOE79_1757 [Sphingomonadales bacterium]|jgi:hypothetical protein|nr:hypothetical protein [Sphingomonadales bacterium]MEA3050939.1 hypothetical protein [Sphingomonadales bacterium]
MRATLMAFLALTSTAALAEQPKQDDASKADKVICRTEPDTGSRLSGTRVCLTREQWAERRRQTREATEHAQMGHADRPGG